MSLPKRRSIGFVLVCASPSLTLASFTPPVCGATAADRRTIWRKVTMIDDTSSTNSFSVGTTFCCTGGLEQCFELEDSDAWS